MSKTSKLSDSSFLKKRGSIKLFKNTTKNIIPLSSFSGRCKREPSLLDPFTKVQLTELSSITKLRISFLRISFLRISFVRISFVRINFVRISFVRIIFVRISFVRISFVRISFVRISFVRIHFFY